jgi:hypothetical protein
MPTFDLCFGHAMSKVTQYVINDIKMWVGLLVQ